MRPFTFRDAPNFLIPLLISFTPSCSLGTDVPRPHHFLHVRRHPTNFFYASQIRSNYLASRGYILLPLRFRFTPRIRSKLIIPAEATRACFDIHQPWKTRHNRKPEAGRKLQNQREPRRHTVTDLSVYRAPSREQDFTDELRSTRDKNFSRVLAQLFQTLPSFRASRVPRISILLGLLSFFDSTALRPRDLRFLGDE